MTKREKISEIFLNIFELLVVGGPRLILFLLIGLFTLSFIFAPSGPDPTIITTTNTFTGTLGMVSYHHTFFGIGGVDATTLSFQNGSNVATFKFNRDLSVIVGNNYTVTYNQTDTRYYNLTYPIHKGFQWNIFANLQNLGFGNYVNSTEVDPLNVILSE